jgi:hypothetical protein
MPRSDLVQLMKRCAARLMALLVFQRWFIQPLYPREELLK